jgi:hypothetical protein
MKYSDRNIRRQAWIRNAPVVLENPRWPLKNPTVLYAEDSCVLLDYDLDEDNNFINVKSVTLKALIKSWKKA